MLESSFSFDPCEPFEPGRRRKFLSELDLESGAGDFGAVRGENPDGGFAVFMTGGLAASSSRDSSSISSRNEGCLNAP